MVVPEFVVLIDPVGCFFHAAGLKAEQGDAPIAATDDQTGFFKDAKVCGNCRERDDKMGCGTNGIITTETDSGFLRVRRVRFWWHNNDGADEGLVEFFVVLGGAGPGKITVHGVTGEALPGFGVGEVALGAND